MATNTRLAAAAAAPWLMQMESCPPYGRRGSPGLDQIFQFESMMIFLNPVIDIDPRPARRAKLAAQLAVAAAAFSAAPATGSGGN